jgi:hypothetical protein
MFRRSAIVAVLVFAAAFFVRVSAFSDAPQSKTPPATPAAHVHDDSGWTLPPDAEQKKSPLTVERTRKA